MSKKIAPFRQWLNKEGLTVPQFVEEARKRGIITAKEGSLSKNASGSVPRNKVLYEKAFPGIKF